jgi:hypothetical protein
MDNIAYLVQQTAYSRTYSLLSWVSAVFQVINRGNHNLNMMLLYIYKYDRNSEPLDGGYPRPASLCAFYHPEERRK